MSKFKAAFLHFLISLIIITAFLLFVYYVWYQRVFFDLAGVSTPLKMLIVVDVVLGPLLTFVVYKHGKKNLKLDLAFIGMIQLLAFGYGAYSVFLGKPSLVIHRTGYLEVLIEKDIDYNQLNMEMQSKNYFTTPVFGQLNDQGLTPITPSLEFLIDVKPFALNDDANLRILRLDQVEKVINKSVQEINDLIKQTGHSMESVFFYELKFNPVFAVAMIDKITFEIVSVISAY